MIFFRNLLPSIQKFPLRFVTLLVVYIIVVWLVWRFALSEKHDARGAAISAASAITVAGAAFIGSWVNGWRQFDLQAVAAREERRQQAVAAREERRQVVYTEVLHAGAAYQRLHETITSRKAQSENDAVDADVRKETQKLLEADLHAVVPVVERLVTACTTAEVFGSIEARSSAREINTALESTSAGFAEIDLSKFKDSVRSDLPYP